MLSENVNYCEFTCLHLFWIIVFDICPLKNILRKQVNYFKTDLNCVALLFWNKKLPSWKNRTSKKDVSHLRLKKSHPSEKNDWTTTVDEVVHAWELCQSPGHCHLWQFGHIWKSKHGQFWVCSPYHVTASGGHLPEFSHESDQTNGVWRFQHSRGFLEI